ncbi:antA/AntB antirepressor family protein [Stutzerimonas nitrititolerans]|uniref:antA/AntB antirepressor family protein n=1 Tax=Stutzerimonas nitrititolerans TaxID=2482751 RepID=UPI0028A83A2F|nr:antA/AntB antirepressor family protein [Stutzerimonas nitrititolerans]
MANTSTTQHTGNTAAASTAGTQQLVRVFDGQIGGAPAQVCDGRELHAFLKNGKQFSDWIKQRISQYGFEENADFSIVSLKSETIRKYANGERKGVSKVSDYHLTLDMAKELSMVENNEQGRKARRYFIDCEKRAQGQPDLALTVETCRQVAFEGRRIRVLMRDGQPWFAAAHVASALGLRSSDRITRSALRHELCQVLRGKQAMNYLAPQAALRAGDYAAPDAGERWGAWFQRTLDGLVQQPLQRAALEAPGRSAVERFGLEQLLSTRLLLGFNAEGGVEVKAVKPEAMVVTPDRLAAVIGDNFVIAQQHLPEILSAVAGRMRGAAWSGQEGDKAMPALGG